MIKRFILLLLAVLMQTVFLLAQNAQELHHLASYETGETEAAETVAFDPATDRVFFTSAGPNKLSILDLTNPGAPALIKEIDLSPYGAGPNSVVVGNGLVAVAVAAETHTDPGKVLFFTPDGVLLAQTPVGANPDMLVFTPDNTKLLVANEGEPNDDYTVDPNGSVTVIDIANQSTATIDFSAYNDKKAHLLNKGVRIFGNNGQATVAQDMEPEYITVSPDGSRAFVNCQENNALAVIDLTNNTIVNILPLGYKDHNTGRPVLHSFTVNEVVPNWPVLGTPVYGGGQPTVYLGGFSGLYYDPTQSNANEYVFYVVPDRGPNAEAVTKATVTPTPLGDLRPYKLPDYQAVLVKMVLNRQTGAVTLAGQTPLFRQDGATPVSGKGNIPGFDEVPVTYADANTPYANADYTDANGVQYHELPYDEFGGDFEGVVRDNQGNFWLCDENRPAIYKFAPNGTLIERYVPQGTSLLGVTPQPPGTYGAETLPAVYSKRRANRGFEAIAYDGVNDVVYAFIQSPIENPTSVVRNKTDVIRILGVKASDGTPVAEYVYLLENNAYYAGSGARRVDKIGDAVYIGDGQFLVLERDSELPGVSEGKKYVFKIDLQGATNIVGTPLSEATTGKTLEQHSADDLVSAGVKSVHKLKVTNLPSLNYVSSDKPEGIALLPGNEIAVINDNDFGLAGAGVADASVLGIIEFKDDNAFDASDRDNKIDIANHRTLGMYLPDAIAAYQAGDGKTYIVTANEGDSRDYDGYSEEKRVRDINLDPTAYPNAAELKKNENLGRLKTTSAEGDYDGDGDYDQIYSFGGRSFSIFDASGNLVYDSGDEFAQATMFFEPALFNVDGGSFDGRSDDKGVEPEAVAVGTIDGYTYAFVGFERQSAIVVYDITDPFNPEFVTYYSNRKVNAAGDVTGDVSPEIIEFVPASESPNGENLLVVGHEVSGSVGIIQVGGELVSISDKLKDAARFKAAPNPATQFVYFDQPINAQIFDQQGRLITTIEESTQLNVGAWEPGLYNIVTKEHGARRFVKL